MKQQLLIIGAMRVMKEYLLVASAIDDRI